MIGKLILAGLLGAFAFLGCGEDSKTLTIQYAKGAYNLQLVAIVTIGPGANSYGANIAALEANGSKLEYWGRVTSASGTIDDSVVEKIKQCAVYSSTVSGSPDLEANGFVAGNVSDSTSCTAAGTGVAQYFTRGFGSGKTYDQDPLSSAASSLIDASNGYVLALFFNNSQGPAISTGSNPLKRCLQICGRKIQNKQFYSARSQVLSDVLTCDLSALGCYDF